MTRWLARILSAIRVALGLHDPSQEPMTPSHGWLLPAAQHKAKAAPRS